MDIVKENYRKCRRCEKIFVLSLENFWPTKNGFQYYCKDCHRIKNNEWLSKSMEDPLKYEIMKEYRRTYRLSNKDRISLNNRERRSKSREVVFSHYGKECLWCGEDDYNVLIIDHTNNDGNKHRQEIGKGTHIYKWLIKNNFPSDFQTLCWNCNMAKCFNNGVLPNNRENKYRGQS